MHDKYYSHIDPMHLTTRRNNLRMPRIHDPVLERDPIQALAAVDQPPAERSDGVAVALFDLQQDGEGRVVPQSAQLGAVEGGDDAGEVAEI